VPTELIGLADYLGEHRETILLAWRRAIQKDSELMSSDSLPRSELFDHIPALLQAFERGLRGGSAAEQQAGQEAQEEAAAHGLERWQQGYDLRKVSREWGKLNHCVLGELDRYAKQHPEISLDAMHHAREVWADLLATGLEESVHQFFTLQQQEAAGHVKDLERALEQLRVLEQERGEVWQQAAHDLRGNLGVVANVSVGLTRHGRNDTSREDFVRILMRNVTSLHQLLDDITSLARLQAGREARNTEPLDATTILEALCESIRPLAAGRGLELISRGPEGFAVEGDEVKIRRIAQNLILNAVKYTDKGSITVSWGESGARDSSRWLLCIEDTGPGFHSASAQPLAAALKPGRDPLPASHTPHKPALEPLPADAALVSASIPIASEAGEGIGLSIVKRLCEMLDAKVELHSTPGVGTRFRILFPRQYPTQAG
jgi:signal transduction histidine kinase